MPNTKVGSGVSKTVAEAANSSWYAFKHFNAGSSQEPHLSYLAGYRRGVADSMADQFGFAGWDLLTHRLVELLDELVLEREAVRIVTGEVAAGNTDYLTDGARAR